MESGPNGRYLEAYAGLNLVAQQQAGLTLAGSITLFVTAPPAQPITRILLRTDGSAAAVPAYSLQIESIIYVNRGHGFVLLACDQVICEFFLRILQDF